MQSSRSLQATAFDLERKLHADQLKHDLEKRHTRDELVERHIIPNANAAP